MENKDILKIIADNHLLCETVRELIASYMKADNRTEGVSDVQLGQEYRAQLTGLRALDSAFRDIAKYKTGGSEDIGRVNRGR